MAQLDRHVLLLNQNYEPLSVCKARRALVLMLLRKAEPVESYGLSIHSVRTSFHLPSVLRLSYFVHVRRREVPLTKRNVMRRDNNTCVYCGRRFAVMTTDHVVPRAAGGSDTWDNLVCACPQCNADKGSRTPQQAQMRLRRRPKTPHYISFAVNALGDVPDAWRQYLFLS